MKKGLLKIGKAIGSIVATIYSVGYANGVISEALFDPDKEIAIRDRNVNQENTSDKKETEE